MLIHEGQERTAAIDVKLAGTLAGLAGALNAAGFQACGFFSANMTGNASSISDHIVIGNVMLAGIFASLIVAFITGAFCAGLIVEAGRRRGTKAAYAYSIMVEGLLLAGIALADIVLPAVQSGPPLVLGLSFVLGLQNATTTLISKARVRTTHISGMATDIGINLASAFEASADVPATRTLRLHIVTLAAFLIGGVIGAAGYISAGGVFFLLCAAALLFIAATYIWRSTQLSR